MGRYLSYMSNTETAYDFDWWTGLWCIGAACGRRVYVDRPRAPVFLNMYVILIGESGVARKSTAIASAVRCVRSVVGIDREVGLIDAKVTPEKLDEILHLRTEEHGSAQLCIAIPELAVFLGTERYIASMPTLLTDLYDSPSIRNGGGTITRGSITQADVWLHFLSASTPIWLLKAVNPNVIEGGFTSRCYFIPSNSPKQRIAWPTETDLSMLTDLQDDLRIIANESAQRRVITLDGYAIGAFRKWYDNRSHAADVFIQSFESREDAHVLRIAAVLSINDGSWAVTADHIGVAIQLIAELKRSSGRIFETTESRTKLAVSLDIIRSQLVSAGMSPIARHRLYLKCRRHMDNTDFNYLLDVLHEIGAIQRFAVQERRGPPTDYIRGTNLLLSGRLGETVMDKMT